DTIAVSEVGSLDLSAFVPDRISKPAKYFLAANVLNGLGNGVFGVVIQLYLMTLGFGSMDLGSIFMMNSLGMLLLTLPAGVIADRYGRGSVFMAGMIATFVAFTLIMIGRSIEVLSIAWLLLGLGNATGSVLGPLYSSLFDSEDMDRAFGLRGAIGILSNAVGSLVGFIPPMLVRSYGLTFQRSYWLVMLISVVFFLAQFPLYYRAIRSSPEPEGNGMGFRFNLRSKAVVYKFSFLYTVQNIAFGFFSLFPYYVNSRFGVQSDALGALYFASRFVQAGSNAAAPKVAKRLGSVKTISLALGLTVPFWLMFPFAPSYLWVSAIYVLRLFIGSFCNPLMPSLFYRLLYEEEKATANSLTTMASMGSNMVAPKLGGFLMENVSIDAPAYLGGALYLVYASSFYLLLNQEAEKTHQSSDA
ncbi:MFS transporter, partial [Candidatus Bathyarchaeota archaeon]